MARTVNIMTSVEPEVKEKAEAVLKQLGISMSTAMTIYLQHIVLHRKIPFEILSINDEPIALGGLSEEEFDEAMNKAATSYANGLCVDIANFKKELNK